ncbi:BTB and MATH domain-containing protein 42 [Folsomia candida]|uniref:BTB and MATH domain-containing protein 42 n=1 Tax=Folsomia candida TaxID=158441 RepID=A0A226DV63_FOLCA|nr:BTB and MATH domain-containing protein 42 [Folsomia candida]
MQITWDIQNFQTLQEFPEELLRLRFPFEFGAELGMKPKWEFSFRKGTNDKIGFWLELLTFEGKDPNVEIVGRLETNFTQQIKATSGLEWITDKGFLDIRSVNVTDIVFPNPYAKFGSSEEPSSGTIVTRSHELPTYAHKLSGGTLRLNLNFTVHLKQLVNTLDPLKGFVHGSGMQTNSACRLNQQNSMLAMLRDGIGSDVTLLSKDNQLVKAHKCILSNNSSVLKAKFSAVTEKEIELVEMMDMGSDALNIFLRFCYTGEIEENWGDFYEEVISAADKVRLIPWISVAASLPKYRYF